MRANKFHANCRISRFEYPSVRIICVPSSTITKITNIKMIFWYLYFTIFKKIWTEQIEWSKNFLFERKIKFVFKKIQIWTEQIERKIQIWMEQIEWSKNFLILESWSNLNTKIPFSSRLKCSAILVSVKNFSIILFDPL